MDDGSVGQKLLRFYDAVRELLTDDRPLEEGQLIDDRRRRVVIDRSA